MYAAPSMSGGGGILPDTQGHRQQLSRAALLTNNLLLVWGTLQMLTRSSVELRAGISGGDMGTGLIPNRGPFRDAR